MYKEQELKEIKINVPSEHNELIKKALENINANDEIKTLWQVINVNAIDRLGMSDHGPIHFQIVSNIALKIARMLRKSDVKLSIETGFGLSAEHGELVVLLASLFHDLGMTINRTGHEEFSLIIAQDVMKSGILDFLPINERTIVISETLHAIISHRKGGTPNTLEAGIVRVADALDMTEGRARVTFEGGNTNIHSISSAAIDKVEIKHGTDEKPISVEIILNNSSGIFQVDDLLKSKIKGSGLEKYFTINAYINAETEKSLFKEFKVI